MAVEVGDRNAQDLAAPGAPGELRFRVVDAEMDELAEELKVLIPQHRSRKQPQLEEHLEPVADSQHRASPVGEFAHFLHQWGEPGDGARPQIIPVREPSREHDAVNAPEVMVLVPEENGLLTKPVLEDEKRVIIAVRTGEDNNTELQGIKP